IGFRRNLPPRRCLVIGRGRLDRIAYSTMNQPSSHPVVPCPIIDLSGAPRERGRLYGELAVDRIRRGVDHYAAQLDANELGWLEIGEIVARFEPTIAAFDPNYIDEMRGIAEGSG